ncbi:MAG: transglycosylase SLT domain-containing protein [Methylococcaceae bacterium]
MKPKNKAGISVLLVTISISVVAGLEHQFLDTINKAAIEPWLLVALLVEVVRQEAHFNPEAVSKAGAKGLMQLMDETAMQLGASDSFNPEQNITAGTKYLRGLIDRYNSVELALVVYTAGEKRSIDTRVFRPIKRSEITSKGLQKDT